MEKWEIDQIKRAIQSCKNKIKHHYEKTHNKVSNAIKNEYTKIYALEKQIPKKPILKYHKEDVTPVQYGRLVEFMCPNCGRFIVAMYETDVERGGGIHEDLKGCSTCLQAIDFTGYYHIEKLDEEIDFKE